MEFFKFNPFKKEKAGDNKKENGHEEEKVNVRERLRQVMEHQESLAQNPKNQPPAKVEKSAEKFLPEEERPDVEENNEADPLLVKELEDLFKEKLELLYHLRGGIGGSRHYNDRDNLKQVNNSIAEIKAKLTISVFEALQEKFEIERQRLGLPEL